MTVVDTSAWIEWTLNSSTGKRVTPLIPDYGDWLVPTMVLLNS